MDVAITPPLGGSETQHHSYNALHLNTEQSSPSVQLRRHVHYSTPEASAPLPPRLVYETAANHTLRSSPISTRSTSSMSQSSSTRPPAFETSEAPSLAVNDGQNHDRMETDMESDESSSEGGEQEPPGDATNSGRMEVEPPEEGEIMDTRPDSVTPETLSIAGEMITYVNGTAAVDAPRTGNPDLVRISSNGSSIDSNADDLTLPDVVVARVVDHSAVLAPTSTPPPLPANGLGFPHTSGPFAADSDADTQAAVVRANEDDSQEEDSDEEDVPYWANFKEDLSQPDQQELKAIEKSSNEIDALDHDHWEQITYEPLDDPEYIPGESGRITWVVKGVNGTPEKPNRETLMRSPSVLIGGYYWNIKYFPRGDEGTQYMSVFIECSTTPREEALTEEIRAEMPIQEKPDNSELLSAQATGEAASSTNPSDSATLMVGGGSPPTVDAPELLLQPSSTLPAGDVPEEHVPKLEKEWEVAAQVGCVVYNPEEPRVHASQTSSHHFYSDYPDFGWIRFHGPWDEIHKRQRFQRQALLRNDTLAFTAYVRLTKDDTKALWWHAPKDTYKWDSLARTGLRRFTTGTLHSSAIISAVSTWLNLRTIADVILNMHIPNPIEESKSRPRPLFLALQDVVSDYFNKRTPREPEASLDGVIKAMEWYGAELDSKMDVVAIWEIIRRILSYEASNTVNIADAPDLFRSLLILRQPDPWRDEQPILDSSASQGPKPPPHHIEPHSVQEVFDFAVTEQPKSFTGWDDGIGHEPQNPSDLPSLFQIELHRQSYNKELRQWRKLTHHIKIDETLTVNLLGSDQKLEYTLKGMIVHSGDLESKNYSAIVRRPQEEGASWVAFAGEQEEKSVTYLTRKQAVTSHEGSGDQATGDAAVAYVVLYERTDSVSRILLTTPIDSEDPELVKSSNAPLGESLRPESSQEEAVIEKQSDDKALSVQVYPSTSFIDYAGRGFMDAGRWPGWGSFELHMPARTTVSEVEKHIINHVTSANGPEKSRQLRLWALDFGDQQYPRGSPGLHMPNSEQWADLSLGKFAQITGGCHFWLHELPKQADVSIVSTETGPQSANTPSMHIGAGSLDGSQTVENQVPEGLASTSLVGDGERNQRASPDTSGAPEDEDTVMDGVSEPAVQNAVDVPATAQPGSQNPDEEEDKAYIFLKTFSHQNQILLGKGSYIIQRQEKVKDTVQKLLGPGYPDEVDVYRESYPALSDVDVVKSDQTFSEIDVCDGDIFIAQHPPSAAEITTLESSGKCSTPVSHFKFLRHYDNPSYSLPHYVSSYFSSPYLSTAQSSGRPHGPGTHISLCGDAYVGNFVGGTKSGHGTMAFSNGDTYTGSWADNEPNGQGKMVYAVTGNTYVGGFKKRKRFGKGTMTYEVADEELQLCRICYEQEMDALFYDCGHVAACVECARQVSGCPVCRKGVRAVVKIWKT